MNPFLRGFVKKELIQALRDPRMKFILFVTPVVQMTLFGIAISNEVKNIRLAALYSPNDVAMQRIYEHALAGKWFVPVTSKERDPFKLIQSGKADAVLVSPSGGLSHTLGRGGASVQLLVDAVNVLKAQAVENYLKVIVQQSTQDYLRSVKKGLPIEFNIRILFNPSLETSIFMVPGVMCMLMVMTTMLLTNIAIVREKELGTFEMLISAPVSPAEVICGKTIPYVILGMSNLPLILGVAVLAFHVPMRGSFWVLGIASFVFVCTSVAIGTLISTFCKNQQQASLGAFLFLFPAIMFSGLMFPLENMPTAIRWVADLDPLSHYLGLLRNILLKGGDLNYVMVHVGILLLMALMSIFISFRRFNTTLK